MYYLSLLSEFRYTCKNLTLVQALYVYTYLQQKLCVLKMQE